MDRRITQYYEYQEKRKDRKRKKRTRSFADKIMPYAKLVGTIIFILLILYTIYTFLTVERIYQ